MKKRKFKKQNIFIFISIIFLIGSICVYGGRFIYFYIDANKDSGVVSLYSKIKSDNLKNKNFVAYPNSYYFKNKNSNNYFEYSNMIFRIVKLTDSNEIVLISDDVVSYLSYGEVKNFKGSYLYDWLNGEDGTGVFERNLTSGYLKDYKICDDKIDKASTKCKKSEKVKIGALTLEDYINSGAKKSYLNIDKSFYLSNMKSDNEVWYVTDENSPYFSDGTDLIGVRPVIVIDGNQTKFSGSGSKDDPYKLNDKSYFNSYVKLGDDLWKVNDVSSGVLSLIKDDSISVNGQKLMVNYSNSGFEYKGYLASYLNGTYVNSLPYKDVILDSSFSNGYYGGDNDFDYRKTLKSTINAKVGLYSIGDIIVSKNVSGFTMTGANDSGDLVYAFDDDGQLYTEDVMTQMSVVPCIKIKQEILKKGTGSLSDPYVME